MSLSAPVYVTDPAVVFREDMKDGGVLYHPETDRAYSLNRLGARIWAMLCEGETRARIVDRLRASFAPDEAQTLDDDVDEFLAHLVKHNLASVEDA